LWVRAGTQPNEGLQSAAAELVAALARAPGATMTTFDGWMPYLLPWACESEHVDTPLQRSAVVALVSLLTIDGGAARTATAHRWLAQMLRRCVRPRENGA